MMVHLTLPSTHRFLERRPLYSHPLSAAHFIIQGYFLLVNNFVTITPPLFTGYPAAYVSDTAAHSSRMGASEGQQGGAVGAGAPTTQAAHHL
jgi:hypothetical protein